MHQLKQSLAIFVDCVFALAPLLICFVQTWLNVIRCHFGMFDEGPQTTMNTEVHLRIMYNPQIEQ